MKIIKDWRFLFIICMMICLSVVYNDMYKDLTDLPSQGWSKEVFLDSVPIIDSNRDYYHEKSFDSFIYEEYICLFVADSENDLSVYKINENGDIVDKKMFENQFQEKVIDIKASLVDGEVTLLYADESKLSKQSYLLNKGEIEFAEEVIIAENYSNYSFKENSVMYSTEDDKSKYIILDLRDENEYTFISQTLDKYDYIDFDHEIIILGEENDKDVLYFSTRIIDKINHINDTELEFTTIGNQYIGEINTGGGAKSSKTVAQDVMALYNEEENSIEITYYFKNEREVENYHFLSVIDRTSLEEINSSYFIDENMNPNKELLSLDSSSMDYISNRQTFIGKTEVSSTEETHSNLVIYSTDFTGSIEGKNLTKTYKYIPSYNYIESDKFDYLIFNEVTDGLSNLYIASDKQVIIDKSQEVSKNDVLVIFLGSMTVFISGIINFMIQFVFTVVPVIAVVIIINSIFFRATEKNPLGIFYLGAILYSLATYIYFLKQFRFEEIASYVPGNLPIYTENYILGSIVVGITLIVSYLISKLYINQNSHKSYLNYLGIFIASNLIFFNILFTFYLVV